MVTATIHNEHYKTELNFGTHLLQADEAEELGGTNFGPSPGQLLSSSLAACTAITLRMYIDRKKWVVDKIRVEVNAEKENNTTVFRREIELTGTLDEAQRAKLLEIANKCPVHQTLTSPIVINTKMI